MRKTVTSTQQFRVYVAPDPTVFLDSVPPDSGNGIPGFMFTSKDGQKKRQIPHMCDLVLSPAALNGVERVLAKGRRSRSRRSRSLARPVTDSLSKAQPMRNLRIYSKEEGESFPFCFHEAICRPSRQSARLRGMLFVSETQVVPAIVHIGKEESFIHF